MKKIVYLAAFLNLIFFTHTGRTNAQSKPPFNQTFYQLNKTVTILDLRHEWNKAKITIHQDTLAMYEEWIRKTVVQSKDLDYSIVISKLDSKLWLYKEGKLEREIDNIVVGPNPVDNKDVLGDGCTPEGIFYACHKNPESRFYKAVQISYPDTTAARKGLARRIISKVLYDRIAKAIRNKEPPPMYTNLGGDICIHGSPVSEGCLGIGSENMDYIFPLLEVSKTPICIVRGTKKEYFVSEHVMQKVRKSRLLKTDIGLKLRCKFLK